MKPLEFKCDSGTYKGIDNTHNSFHKTGKFSTLTQGYRVEDSKPVIIKQIKNIETFGDEVNIRVIKEFLCNLHTLHPSIIQTYEVIKNDEGCFIIREFIEGSDLKTLNKNKNTTYFSTPDFTAKVGIQVCDILKELHKQAIFHRDIKPANILIEHKQGKTHPDYYNPKVRLIDFELAQLHGHSIFNFEKTPFALGYSAPEQLLRFQNLIYPGSDLFSLAVTLYEFLAKKMAFHHSNPELLMNLQLNHPLIKHVRIPYELFAILHKATQKQAFQLPPNRYSTEEKDLILSKGCELRFNKAEEMKAALEGFLLHYDALPPANNIFGKIRAFFK